MKICLNIMRVRKLGFIVFISASTTIVLYLLSTTSDSEPLDQWVEGMQIDVGREHGDFQRVTGDNSLLVYSAYIDKRINMVRVIAITKNANLTAIYCLLDQTQLVQGYVEHLPESHKLKYTAAYVFCHLNEGQIPHQVSVLKSMSDKRVRNLIQVHGTGSGNEKYMFCACVSPLHSNFDSISQLTQWIELNRLLGVEKFIFYINSVSKKVLNILKHYSTTGVATLLPWTLPRKLTTPSRKLLHYYGQLAALNDCVYRLKGVSQFITTIDIDEFIIPQIPRDMTWSAMINRLPSSSVYIFRSSFFRKLERCFIINKCRDKLLIDAYKLRDNYIFPSDKRSKYIAKTNDLITVGIHFTWDIITGSVYTVSSEVGLLHHYRQEKIKYTLPLGSKITRTDSRKIRHGVAGKFSHALQKRLTKLERELD